MVNCIQLIDIVNTQDSYAAKKQQLENGILALIFNFREQCRCLGTVMRIFFRLD
jgi:hypothetical protein